MNTYDIMLIFLTDLSDDRLDEILTAIRNEIAKLGGEPVDTTKLGRRQFARPMHKRVEGVYLKLRVKMPPASVAPLLGRFKLNQDVFRSQVLRVVEPSDGGGDAKAAAQPVAADKLEVGENG